MLDKTGRERRYDITPTAGFASREVGFMASYLAELRQRVIDQFSDLPDDALSFAPGSTGLTIGQLVLHLCWAEVGRVSETLGALIDPEIEEVLSAGSLSLLGKKMPPARTATELVELVRRSGEIIFSLLSNVPELDQPTADDGQTLRGLLMHLQWHWSFHSGHIGLIRLLWGSDYTWTMGHPMAPAP